MLLGGRGGEAGDEYMSCSPDMLLFRGHWPFFLFRFPSGDLALHRAKQAESQSSLWAVPSHLRDFILSSFPTHLAPAPPSPTVCILPPTPISA